MTARHCIANGLPAQHRPFAIPAPIRQERTQLLPFRVLSSTQPEAESACGVEGLPPHQKQSLMRYAWHKKLGAPQKLGSTSKGERTLVVNGPDQGAGSTHSRRLI
jgi:hypothetical protein